MIIIRNPITRTTFEGAETIALSLPAGWKQSQQGATGLHVLTDPQGRVYFAWLEVARPSVAFFRVFGETRAARRRLKALAQSSPKAWTRRELIADTSKAAMALKAALVDRRSKDEETGEPIPDGRHRLACRRTVAGYDHPAEDDAAPATIGDLDDA